MMSLLPATCSVAGPRSFAAFDDTSKAVQWPASNYARYTAGDWAALVVLKGP
jgi:hypothetical protein